jgi:RNA polymerase sigma factor
MSDDKYPRKIDELAVLAAGNEAALEQLIMQERAYILACAGKTLVRHIHKESEEEFLAIEAFVEAVKDYSYEKGSFLSFAKLVIRRRLIDGIRKEKTMEHIIPMDPSDLVIEQDKYDAEHLWERADPETGIAYEIESLSKVLKKYGFSFFDLTACSPKAEKTKEACRTAVLYIIETEMIFLEIRAKRLLPIKIIEKNTGVPRKILERHRKYIIAVAEILKGEYRCLAPYVSSMKRRCSI